MEKKNGEKGGEVGGQRLRFSGPVVRAERKRGQGCPGFGTSQVEEEGGWPRCATRAEGGPDPSAVRSSGGSLGLTVPGRARGRQGKREKGERGEASQWAGPWSGSRLSAEERERGRE
jgi:hypothetical protein